MRWTISAHSRAVNTADGRAEAPTAVDPSNPLAILDVALALRDMVDPDHGRRVSLAGRLLCLPLRTGPGTVVPDREPWMGPGHLGNVDIVRGRSRRPRVIQDWPGRGRVRSSRRTVGAACQS